MSEPKNTINGADTKREGGITIETPIIMVIDDLPDNRANAAFAIAAVLNADYGAKIDVQSLIDGARDAWEEEPLITDHVIFTHDHNDARAVIKQLQAEGKPLPTVVLSDNDTPETNNGIKWIKELAAEGSPLKVALLTGGDGVDEARQMKEDGHPNLISAIFGKTTVSHLRTLIEEATGVTPPTSRGIG